MVFLCASRVPLMLLFRHQHMPSCSSSTWMPQRRMLTTATEALGERNVSNEEEKRRSEQQKKEEDEKQLEKQRRRHMRAFQVLLASVAFGTASLFYSYGSAPRDALTDELIEDKHSGKLLAPFFRVIDQLAFWRNYMAEPSRDKLLPDPVKPPWHQPKLTVVIEMRNILISPRWDYKLGHHFVKRPALDYFLDVIGYPNFELVIFTSDTAITGTSVVQQMDPKGQRISHALFRDCTKYDNGAYIKDLSHLNRDLSRVIYIDWDPEAFQLNPDNVLRVPKWEGDDKDTWLIELAELLKTIHLHDVDDVRPVLQFYSQFDNPMAEFRRRAQQLVPQQGQEKTDESQKDGNINNNKNDTNNKQQQQSALKKYGSFFGNRHRI